MISCPATTAVPLVGGTSVVNMRMSVLLPAPFGPSRPKISPLSHREADVIHRQQRAKALADAFDLDRDAVWGLALRFHGG